MNTFYKTFTRTLNSYVSVVSSIPAGGAKHAFSRAFSFSMIDFPLPLCYNKTNTPINTTLRGKQNGKGNKRHKYS